MFACGPCLYLLGCNVWLNCNKRRHVQQLPDIGEVLISSACLGGQVSVCEGNLKRESGREEGREGKMKR